MPVESITKMEVPVMLSEVLSKIISYSPEAMANGSMWWWVLPFAPDVPERLIVGKEREFLTCFFERASVDTAAITTADDPAHSNVIARPETDGALRHVSVVGDTYTILLDGGQTDNYYCLIDMLIPQHGGPPPHRHDFEETFTVLEGEIEATFRGQTSTVKAGETLHIPANAPHRFTNNRVEPARLLCTCSPAG